MLEYASCRESLAKLLAQKDDYWRQQAKCFWLVDCDLNTKYFHSVTSSRKWMNKVIRLVDEEWTIMKDDKWMHNLIQDYFTKLSAENLEWDPYLLDYVISCVTSGMNDSLLAHFQDDEFKITIFQMALDKSLGPNGLNPKFF